MVGQCRICGILAILRYTNILNNNNNNNNNGYAHVFMLFSVAIVTLPFQLFSD